MGGVKIEERFELNEDHLRWLKEMADKYGLEDESKALRVVLDFARHEADEEELFTDIRCHHCGA